MKNMIVFTLLLLITTSCATGRDLTSDNYIPEWENKLFSVPNPSETSSGYWAAKTVKAVGHGVERVLLFPFAILGNVVVNAYYIPTWPFRWLFRGDKRFVVWKPIFSYGEEIGSDYYSKKWNEDLA